MRHGVASLRRAAALLAAASLWGGSGTRAYPLFYNANGSVLLTTSHGGDVVLRPDSGGAVIATSVLSAQGGVALNSTVLNEQLLARLQPPLCTAPGGDKLQYNGTAWLCVCVPGWSGPSCLIPPPSPPSPSPPPPSPPPLPPSPPPGPCAAYTTVDDPSRDVGAGAGWLNDDNLQQGWYRFKQSGADAFLVELTNCAWPAGCLVNSACSTQRGSMLTGPSHPAPNSTVSRTLLFPYGASWTSYPLTIVECGGFYVYGIFFSFTSPSACDFTGCGSCPFRICTTRVAPSVGPGSTSVAG